MLHAALFGLALAASTEPVAALAAAPAAAEATGSAGHVTVVRVDDRDGRNLPGPYVTLLFEDGRWVGAAARDDASDAEDAFAGDNLWVARLSAPTTGKARLLVTDGPAEKAHGAWIDREVTIGARGVTRLQFAVPAEAVEPDAADVEESVTKTEGTAYPLSTAAVERAVLPKVGRWQALHYAFATALVAFGLVILHGVRDRIRAVEADLSALVRPAPPPARRRYRLPTAAWSALSFVAVGAVAVAVWGPSLLDLRHRFLGVEHVDHYGTQWFYWFAEWALRELRNPAMSDRFFFPWGKDLYAHTGANILDGYVALPFRLLFGQVAGYNLFILAGVAANGWAFWLLSRDVTDDRVAAGVGSVLFALFPYTLLEFQEGRPTQGIVVLPVLFLRYTLRCAQRPGWRDAAIAGVLLAFCGFQYWFYAIFGGLVALGHGVWRTLSPLPGSGGRFRTLARHAGMALVALALAGPVAAPLAMKSTSGEVAGLLDADRWSFWSTPPVTVEGQYIAIFAWQPFKTYAGFFVQDEDDGEERFIEEKLTMPWILIPLVAVYLLRPHRFSRGSFAALVAFAVIVASGPSVLVGDVAVPNVPYIYMVKMVGVFKRLWWPQRMTVFLAIPATLAMVSVLSWLRRVEGPRAQSLAVGLVSIAWAADLADATVLPFPGWNARVPAGYQCLAQDPEGAIIELPLAWTQAHVYYQTVHEHPMLGGMLEDNASFTPPEFTWFRERNAMVKGLYEAADSATPTLEYTAADAQAVRDLGYRYVVVQRDAWFGSNTMEQTLDETALLALEAVLDEAFGEPVYADARIDIYAPWGDPAPCDPASVMADRAPVGKLEVVPRAREADIDKQLFTRL